MTSLPVLAFLSYSIDQTFYLQTQPYFLLKT